MSSSVLPAPTAPAAAAQSLAEVLAEVVGTERVSPDAHFFDDLGADSMLMARFCARVRKRPDLPSVSMKDVYQHPSVASLAAALAPPPDPREKALAEVLAEVVGTERVSPDAHFFDDLGADSMLMARFCARVRKRTDLPSVSMKDVYAHPTIRGLASAVADVTAAPVRQTAAAPADTLGRASTAEFVLCGTLQFLIFVAYSCLGAVVVESSFSWISAGSSLIDVYLRSLAGGGATFLAMCLLPILMKWVLVGRWRPRRIRIWSLDYVRFWLVKTLVVANPLVLFAGTPLYALYLRALGAKVGRAVVIFSRHLPVCTDLLTIGDGSVVEKDAFLNCYRAVGGVIETDRVTLGKDVFLGEKSVLDIRTSLGDGAQLGHASSLQAGQAVPAGEHWHGSPGQPTGADYRRVGALDCGPWRRFRYAVLQFVYVLSVVVPVAFGGIVLLFREVPWLAALLDPGPRALTDASFYVATAVASLVLFLGSMFVSVVVVTTVPRLMNLALRPDVAYRLYGIRYALYRTIARLTNRKFYHELFGDSSYVVHYLQCLGYRLSPVVQTGSNFGTEVKHDNPYLSAIGSGTVVASGISIVNASHSSTSFSVSRTSIGAQNFLGNDIVYPPQGKTGDNCLLATKVLVPIDGEVREGVGLLGSPSFEIPRTVQRDSRFYQAAHGPDLPRRLAAKNRHNLVSIGLFLLSRWFYLFSLLLIGFAAADFHDLLGAVAIAAASILILPFTIVYFATVERASTGFRGVRPKYCSIYEIDFWRTERFFKLCARANVHRLLNGTPFKALAWRLLGVRVGRRLFDDGAGMSEKNIVTIGNDVVLNAGSYIQCHSQEDYAFKSDATSIGSGCTVGVAAMVHYGVKMGKGAVLAPDSFLMKGEEVPRGARWGGNPAQELVATGPAGPGALLGVPTPAAEGRTRRRIRPVPVAAALVALALPVGAAAALGVPDLRGTAGATNPLTAPPAPGGPGSAAPPAPAAVLVESSDTTDDTADDTDPPGTAPVDADGDAADAVGGAGQDAPTTVVTPEPAVQVTPAPARPAAAPKVMKAAPKSTTKRATKPTTKATRTTAMRSSQRGRA